MVDLELAIRGGRVLTPDGFARIDVGLAAGRIVASGGPVQAAEREFDAHGLYVLPGFVDVHVHGAGGSSRPGDMAAWLPRSGVTAFVPTLAASSPEQTLAFVGSARGAADAGRAEVLGSHLEGPFLHPAYAGAQPEGALRPPDLPEVERILAAASGTLRRMTLAPELPGAEAVVRRLVSAGVQVSLGHSACSYGTAQQAARWGASSVTHCYNAMAPFHHREPGLVGAALTGEPLAAELIADGVHVHPAAALLLVRVKGSGDVALVTDALPALGLEPGRHQWMGRRIVTDGHVARLANGSLAGSVTPMLGAVQNLVHWGTPLERAVQMASAAGARLAGVADRKGAIREGYDADIVILDERLQLIRTYCRGQLAFGTP